MGLKDSSYMTFNLFAKAIFLRKCNISVEGSETTYCIRNDNTTNQGSSASGLPEDGHCL